ncbi:MAG: hypothetical protein IKV67_03225 [Paludibacteraceae bacterium]|nr:hypothetical protein [Paludibacteraceae bacterium]
MKEALTFKLKNLEYASVALFFIVTFVLSIACEQDFLYALHDYSLYLDSDPFRTIILSYGAGCLSLVSRFITQFFISPVFGAFAVSATLTAIFAILLRAFAKQTNAKKIVFAAIPPLALLVAVCNLEYLLFDKVDGSIVMSLLLGSLIAVLLSWWMQVENKISLYLSMVVAEFSYFAIGVFSPLSMLIGAAANIKKDNKKAMMLAGIGLASWFGFNYLTANLLNYEVYSLALFAPLYVSHSSTFFAYSLIAMALLVVYPFVANKCGEETELSAKKLAIPAIAFGLVIVVAKLCCYNDESFHKILRLQRLENDEKWSEMVTEARNTTHPTFDIYAYYLEALIANGEKVDQMFKFPVDWESYNTGNFCMPHMIHYEDFAFATGNYCMSLFHAMEYYQLTGENFRRLKRMMRCAVMMEEPELTERYLKILETSSVYSDYAKEWRKYANDKQQLLKDREAYKNFDSYFEVKDDWFIAYSAADFISERANISNPKIAEARILAELYAKDLEAFARDIPVAAQIYKGHVPPKCIQEAACLCAIMGNTKPVQSITVDRKLAMDAQKFVKECKKAGKNGKEKLSGHQGSYLYYYFYKNVDTKNYKGGDLKK